MREPARDPGQMPDQVGHNDKKSPAMAGLLRFLDKLEMTSLSELTTYLLCWICAWAAARRAIGTRNGEQET